MILDIVSKENYIHYIEDTNQQSLDSSPVVKTPRKNLDFTSNEAKKFKLSENDEVEGQTDKEQDEDEDQLPALIDPVNSNLA